LSVMEKEFVTANLNVTESLAIDKIEEIKNIITDKQNRSAAIKNQLQSVNQVEGQLQNAKENYNGLKLNLQNAHGEAKSIAERINRYKADIVRITGLLQEVNFKKIEISNLISNLLLKFGLNALEKDAKQILINRAAAYTLSKQKLQQFQIDQSALKSEIENIEGTLKIRQSELSSAIEQLKTEMDRLQQGSSDRVALFGDKDPVFERSYLEQVVNINIQQKNIAQEIKQQKKHLAEQTEIRIAEEERKYNSLNRKLEDLNQNLLALLNANRIASLIILESMSLSPEIAQQISQLKKDLETTISGLKERIKAVEKDLKNEKERALTEETTEILIEKQATVDTQLALLNQEIGKLKQILQDDTLSRAKFSEITMQIELQKSEFNRWNNLNALIGSADGKKFSRFAQGLTLARLTDLANLHLQKFNDRYQILKSTYNDLELLVVDGYQADAVRPMASLSGGESFLVSLALALGLSDLASHKVQINSLFIDEGFGTLDADTLDTAIGALENLQAKGKSIGIISHVEALKERIGTQIQLSKQPGGVSRIKVTEFGKELFEA